MAKCRECNGKVDRSAEYCQHCGARHPADGQAVMDELSGSRPRSRFRMSTPIGIVVLIIIGFALAHNDGSKGSAPETGCKADWKQCTDNSDLVNNYLESHIDAQYDCKKQATSLAKYGDPKFPWPYFFSTYHTGNQYPKTGVITLIEKGAQYQNGFGAMVHSEVTCIYDLNAKRVLNIDIEPE